MPDYTLLCKECKKEFERFIWGDLEEGTSVCPKCQSRTVTVLWAIERSSENLSNFGCA